MCVVDMFAQIDCDVLHPAITSVLFSCLFWRVLACVCGTKHCCCFAGIFFFFLISILSLFEDYILISACLISQRYDCACVFMCVCVSVHSTCFLVAAL